METKDLVAFLQRLGVSLSLQGYRLAVEVPPVLDTGAFWAFINKHREALFAFVARQSLPMHATVAALLLREKTISTLHGFTTDEEYCRELALMRARVQTHTRKGSENRQ